MMRYTIMKRITQIFASILFIITVVTIYLTFDFAISNALPKKYSTTKYDENIFKQTTKTTVLSLLKFNEASKHNYDNEHLPINSLERLTRSAKKKQYPGKAAQFHKSKTGVKINQIKKPVKGSRKRLSSTKIPQRKDLKSRIVN